MREMTAQDYIDAELDRRMAQMENGTRPIAGVRPPVRRGALRPAFRPAAKAGSNDDLEVLDKKTGAPMATPVAGYDGSGCGRDDNRACFPT